MNDVKPQEEPDVSGTVDTSTESQSADATSGIFHQADELFEENEVPEGTFHALVPDPAASGEDAMKVDYSDYDRASKDPVQVALRQGYAPGLSPDDLAARAEMANADSVVDDDKVEEEVREEKSEQSKVEDKTPEDKDDEVEDEVVTDDAKDDDIDLNKATAAETVAYIKTATPQQRERVMEAELSRDNPRKTVMEALEDTE